MVNRALLFGAIAANYERYRPGYPDEVAATILAYAGRPIRTALEIGAGTGKATRVFAARGVAVTATDPDAHMLAELRKHVPDTVTTITASLEDVEPGHTFDLVYAAASLHWTDPAGRWAKIAELLPPGGVFASFAGPILLSDPHVEDLARAARSPWLTDDQVASPQRSQPGGALQWPGNELLDSDQFTDVRELLIKRRYTIPGPDYVGLLATVSAYLMLPDAERREVFTALIDALPAEVGITADIDLHLARRA